MPLPAKPVATSTMTERLRVLRRILEYAAMCDSNVRNFAKTIAAQVPSGNVEKVDKLLSLPESRLVAGQMHVVHQLTLFMVRLLGPHLSEPFGMLSGTSWRVMTSRCSSYRRRAGGPSPSGDDLGEMVVSGHKKGGKTKAAYRLVGLPRQFATLIRSVIAADRRLVDRPDDARAMASAGRKRSPSTPTPCSPRLAGSGHKIAETFPRLGRLVIWTAATLGHGGVVLFGAPAPIELLEHGPARQATFLPAAEVTGRSR